MPAKTCPNCDYDLTGLKHPPNGEPLTRPECGRLFYDYTKPRGRITPALALAAISIAVAPLLICMAAAATTTDGYAHMAAMFVFSLIAALLGSIAGPLAARAIGKLNSSHTLALAGASLTANVLTYFVGWAVFSSLVTSSGS